MYTCNSVISIGRRRLTSSNINYWTQIVPEDSITPMLNEHQLVNFPKILDKKKATVKQYYIQTNPLKLAVNCVSDIGKYFKTNQIIGKNFLV